MSATTDKLVRMVNQIATEFEGQQPGNAVAATWDHLWHFWDPRMRDRIVTHLDTGGEGLSATSRAAIARLGSRAEPQSQTRATEFGVDADGNTESDAG
ncbi:formate dehydrogenase [Sphingomonas gilva]|uniref:Formate dehydrogenase n=1 Tax=Sphingomonas gilva TaxID=2305907 RepID=A0A396RMB1_9SPHN|nr:formate dehydrogenase subunit delta [Sphingomonas gilva]RHW17557.1 formate dehydrogenase [Sphingomonas gilva]